MNKDDKKVLTFPQKNKKENASAENSGGFFCNKRKLLIICIIVISCIILAVAGVFIYQKIRNKTSVNNHPETSFVKYATAFEDAQFVSLGDTFVIATDSAITGFTNDGVWKWNYEGNFENIILTVCDEYAVVSEIDQTGVLLFSEKGYEKRTSVDGNILFARAEKNMLAVGFVYENYEYGITLFDVTNEEMQKFTRKYASIYMLSCIMSEKNTFICVSGVDKESTGATSVLTFVKEKDGEVYSTITEDDVLYPLLTSVGDSVFVANSDRLKLLKRMPSATETSDKEKVIWERNGSAEKIISMASVSDTVGVIRKSEMSANTDSILEIYDASGNLIKALHTNMNVNGIIAGDNSYVIFNDDTVAIYKTNGILIGYFEETAIIKNICAVSGLKIAIMTDAGITIIDFNRKGD